MTNTTKRVVVTGTNSFAKLAPINVVIRMQEESDYPALKDDKPYRKFAKKARWQRD